jgi:hypothetical protein
LRRILVGTIEEAHGFFSIAYHVDVDHAPRSVERLLDEEDIGLVIFDNKNT